MFPQNTEKYKDFGRKVESRTEKFADFSFILILKRENT